MFQDAGVWSDPDLVDFEDASRAAPRMHGPSDQVFVAVDGRYVVGRRAAIEGLDWQPADGVGVVSRCVQP